MATYKEIMKSVKSNFGYNIKTCWIADMKEKCGLNPHRAYNRISDKRKYPCPEDKTSDIKKAFKHSKMI